MATVKQYKQALIQLKIQPWGLKQIGEKIENILKNANTLPKRVYSWKDRQLVLDGETSLVMGILNLTPDSFSDGGSYNELYAAIRHVEKMQADGADIIDIGAESTRPYDGGQKISAAEEMDRLLPFLQKILPHCSVPVSIDTYKAEVADAALAMGAHIINDIWGLQYDAVMPSVAAKYDVPVIVMHNKTEISYPMGVMADIEQFLSRSIAIGIEKGIKGENIIIDPGIGFAKTAADNIEIMGHLDQFKNLSCPILLGASRKKFIGHVLDLPVNERLEGTIAASALGKIKGVQIHRVHDVKAVKRTLTMMDAMIRSEI
jgi:dihydropteroate synthase